MEDIISGLVREFERGKLNRRDLIRQLAVVAAAAVGASPAVAATPAGKAFKVTAFNHVSYQVADYRKSRDFYASLLGMKVQHDYGKECELAFGNNILIVRPHDRAFQPLPGQPSGIPRIDHIAYTVEGWGTDKSVKPALQAELERRGLKVDEVKRSHAPITKGEGDSFIVRDPDGFPIQLGGEEQ
jgi:catechol 2,3-dioxygenase-like lactoylglutathione lyase family enzyme